MELLNKIFATIFYILFFSLTFLKIRNVVLIKKMNYKEIYKNIKKDLKRQKLSKYLFIIIIINIIMLAIYLIISLVVAALSFFMIVFTLGGVMYIEAGGDSTFFDNLMSFVGIYFSLFKYSVYYLYLIVYMIFIRSIYINILSYKKLKNNDILNSFQQNVSKQSNNINTEKNTITKKIV